MVQTIPLLTFAEKVEPIVRLCHVVIEKHGGRRGDFDVARAGYYRGGYRFQSPVAADSEPDYALRILWTLNIAHTAPDRDQAMKYAWAAGQLIFEAHVVFKGKKTALHAAFRAGQAHTKRANENQHGVQWQWAIDRRKPWRSKRAVITELAEADEVRPDSIKRQLRRLRARASGSLKKK